MTNRTEVKDRKTALGYLSAGRDPGFRKTEYETAVVLTEDGEPAIQLFGTIILVYHEDGSVTLNSGGYLTRTTKRRINDYQDVVQVYQDRNVWYVNYGGYGWNIPENERTPFKDNMRVYPDGTTVYPGDEPDPVRKRELADAIVDYAHNYAEALVEGKVPAPDSGDCQKCKGFFGTKASGGEHLLSHIKEGYYAPSLVREAFKEYRAPALAWNALNAFWYGNPEHRTSEWIKDLLRQHAYRAIRSYLRARLGLPR